MIGGPLTPRGKARSIMIRQAFGSAESSKPGVPWSHILTDIRGDAPVPVPTPSPAQRRWHASKRQSPAAPPSALRASFEGAREGRINHASPLATRLKLFAVARSPRTCLDEIQARISSGTRVRRRKDPLGRGGADKSELDQRRRCSRMESYWAGRRRIDYSCGGPA